MKQKYGIIVGCLIAFSTVSLLEALFQHADAIELNRTSSFSAIRLLSLSQADNALGQAEDEQRTVQQRLARAELMIRLERPEQAISILESILTSEALPADIKRKSSRLLLEHAEFGTVLAIVEAENLPVDHEIEVALQLADSGQLDRALAIILPQPTTLEDVDYYDGSPAASGRVTALAEISVQLASLGRIEQSRQLLDESLSHIEELPQGYTSNGGCENARAGALSAIAKGYAAIDALEDARNTAVRLYTCSPAIPFNSPASDQADLFDEILDNLETLDQVMRLLPEHWQTDDISTDKAATNAAFAIRIAELGAPEVAIRLAEQANYDDIDRQTYGFPEKDLWYELAEEFRQQGDISSSLYATTKYEEFQKQEK